VASWSIIGVVHADSKKLSGVYGMSAEDTFDEDEIDWETFDWDDMPAAEDTETNEANKDSVATLNHDPDHDDWDDDLEMDRSALLKAIIDKCEKDGHATSSTVDAEAVDEFVLATFGTTKVKRGLCHLMGEQLQQIREAFAADDKGSEARYAKLVAAIGCRSVRQIKRAFTKLRRESGKHSASAKLTGEQRQQIHEEFTSDDKGNPARYAELATSVGCTAGQVVDAFTKLRRESGKRQTAKLTGEQRQQIHEEFAEQQTQPC